MAYDHESDMQHPERQRGAIENPKVSTMLGSAGLTAIDLQLFDRLYQQGQSLFVHGSIIADRITPKSDIDFTVIGHAHDMSPELRDELMPGLLAARALGKIDYISTSVRSQHGRKISMHISEPEFRSSLPDTDKPFATEYRPGKHAKVGPRHYFLAGANPTGNIRLINFLAESIAVGNDGSTVTDIPQTGKLVLENGSILVGDDPLAHMSAEHVIRLRADGEPDTTPVDAEELMILGLEFDKMLSDTSMYNDPDAEQRYVKKPITRNMEAVGAFTSTDPAVITNRLFGELANHWPKVKPHKSR